MSDTVKKKIIPDIQFSAINGIDLTLSALPTQIVAHSGSFKLSWHSFFNAGINTVLYNVEIDGRETNWQRNTTADINLEPGKYTVRIKARCEGGAQNVSREIILMVPSPWMKWPLILLSSLSIALVLFLSYKYLKSKKEIARLRIAREQEKERHIAEITQKNRELADINTELESKKKEIDASIDYAQGLQTALFPTKQFIRDIFPESFILIRQKDTVGGDFYWATQVKDNDTDMVYLVLGDCTGHGIPGAMLTVLAINTLNNIVSQGAIKEPVDLVSRFYQIIDQSFKQNRKDSSEIILVAVDFIASTIDCFSSDRSILLKKAQDPDLLEIKKNDKKATIDRVFSSTKHPFTKRDTIYLM